MRLVDTYIRIVPTAQAHFRSAGGIGAAGPSLQNTGGGQQLWAMADGGDRFTRGVEGLYQFNNLSFRRRYSGARPPGITSAS